MVAFLKLIRYQNLLMVLLMLVLTKYAIITSFTTLFSLQFTLLIISILCITASGYIFNDIYDLKTDLINKPNKVYIGKSITHKAAWHAYYAFTIAGLIIGGAATYLKGNTYYIFFFVVSVLLLYGYSKWLKRIAFVGNFVVAFLTALPLFMVAVFEKENTATANNILEALIHFFDLIPMTTALFCYYIFAFSMTLIREIIKDIEDIKGDYALKMKTLPILIGIQRTKNITFVIATFVFLFLVVLLKEELIHFQLLFWYAILFVIVPFAWFLFQLKSAKSQLNFSKLSRLLKIIMCFGILSMLFIQL